MSKPNVAIIVLADQPDTQDVVADYVESTVLRHVKDDSLERQRIDDKGATIKMPISTLPNYMIEDAFHGIASAPGFRLAVIQRDFGVDFVKTLAEQAELRIQSMTPPHQPFHETHRRRHAWSFACIMFVMAILVWRAFAILTYYSNPKIAYLLMFGALLCSIAAIVNFNDLRIVRNSPKVA